MLPKNCEKCGTGLHDKIWDTCLCGKNICFPCVGRRLTDKGQVEIRCSDTCEMPNRLEQKP